MMSLCVKHLEQLLQLEQELELDEMEGAWAAAAEP